MQSILIGKWQYNINDYPVGFIAWLRALKINFLSYEIYILLLGFKKYR